MRKRNCRVEVYLTKTELEALTKKVRKSGLSREGFCRRILTGAVVKEAPPADVPALIRELRNTGNVLERIAKLSTDGFPDAARLNMALEDNRNAERLVVEAYTNAPD